MAVTIVTGTRKRLCIGPGYVDFFIGQAAGNADPVRANIWNPRLEGSLVPISATTGAGDMTVTYSAQTPFPGPCLVTFSQTAASERAAFQLWGY